MTIPSVATYLEAYFLRHGRFIARNPLLVIVSTFLISSVSLVGFINFHWEANVIKLWLPIGSEFVNNYEHLWQSNPPEIRLHQMVFHVEGGGDILQPQYFKQMYKVRKKFKEARVGNRTWEDACFMVPIVNPSIDASDLWGWSKRKRRRKRDDSDFADFFGASDGGSFFGEIDEALKVKDPSVEYYPEPFCDMVAGLPSACFEDSLFELWAKDGEFDESVDEEIENLTRDKILDKINNYNMSGLFLMEKDFTNLIGGVQLDKNGNIVGAKAIIHGFFGKMNTTQALVDVHSITDAMGVYVDIPTIDMEAAMVDSIGGAVTYDGGLVSYLAMENSFNAIASQTIFSDFATVAFGFCIVLLFVVTTLGNFLDKIENRVYLSIIGLMSLYLAIGVAYSLAGSMGFPFSPLHSFIPFLLVGLGVDNMFVTTQSFQNVDSGPGGALPLEERFGLTMKHAGVTITITTLTSFIAFAIGATTTLPALRSFCMYCSVGILMVYFLHVTFFVGCMVYDQRRQEARRNGFLPCIQYPKGNAASSTTTASSHLSDDRNRVKEVEEGAAAADHVANNTDEQVAPLEENFNEDKVSSVANPSLREVKITWLKQFREMKPLQAFFAVYARNLVKWPAKLFVLTLTLGIFGVSVYGNFYLKHEFDPMMFIPQDSYLKRFVDTRADHFPLDGEVQQVFMTDIKLPEELRKLDVALRRLRDQTDILNTFEAWYFLFEHYYNENIRDLENGTALLDLSEDAYRRRLTQFLFSSAGAKFRLLFRFEEEPSCTDPAPDMLMFLFTYNHPRMAGPSDKAEAMNRIKSILREANFSAPGSAFPFSKEYGSWETDLIIMDELYRNIFLAFACIFVTTLLMLSSLIACLQVLLAVVLTLLDVSGMMYFWDLPIDTISSTMLIISIGVCVDYSAHIAHYFLGAKGSRNKRAQDAVTNIGPAVLNGCVSTFLSIILLADSNSSIFEVFFKIFFLVILFAAYNGLVVLPVLLSIAGPSHHSTFKAIKKALTKKGKKKDGGGEGGGSREAATEKATEEVQGAGGNRKAPLARPEEEEDDVEVNEKLLENGAPAVAAEEA